MRISGVSMARLDIILPDDLEKEFRNEVFRAYGMKKGNISLAIESAIKLWLEKQQRSRK